MRSSIRLIRFSHWLVLLLPLSLAPGLPQAADCFDWPKPLNWDDFKGPVPANVTEAAKKAKEAHDKVGKAEGELKAANDELKNKNTERQRVINDRAKELAAVDADFDPRIKAKIDERAKAALTPDDVKAKATDDVNNDKKLDANAKAGKLKKIDSDYKNAQKKYDDPAAKKAREGKLSGLDTAIGNLEKQKSAKHGTINDKYDKKLNPIDKEIEGINGKIEAKQGELKKAQDAEDAAQAALGALELAATMATPVVGKLEMEACGKIKNLPVKAVFCPDQSYVLPEAKKEGSAAMLKHEQVHFDIAEKHARLFKQEVKKLIDAFNAAVDNLNQCHPKNLGEALDKAKQEFDKNLDAAQAKAVAAYNAEQEAYDHDPAKGPPAEGTAHGINEGNQKAWSDKIANDLKPAK